MTLARKYRAWGAGALGLALLLALGTTWLGHREPTRWHITEHGLTLPLSDAAVLFTETGGALVWQPAEAPIPFALTPLDAPERTVPLQPYAEGVPTTWRAVLTARGTLHVVWQERDGRLRSALLTADGVTLRGPVTLAETAERDFAPVALADGSAWVLWRTATERIASVLLDAEGRPGPVTVHAPRHVQKLAAAGDTAHGVHVAWAERSAPDTLTLHYAAPTAPRAAEAKALTNSATLGTWTLAPSESVRTFALGVDATHSYLLLGEMDASAPHHERVTVLSFPLDAPERAQRIPLTLAARPTPKSALPLGTYTVPQAETLPTDAVDAAPLRWPRPATGARDFFALALAVWREGRWQPALVYFQNGEPRGYEVLSGPPADAAPPTLALRPDSAPVLSWAGLVRGEVYRYSARAVP